MYLAKSNSIVLMSLLFANLFSHSALSATKTVYSDVPAQGDVEIIGVTGRGGGCLVDEDGNPDGWNYTINNETAVKTIGLTFQDFAVRGGSRGSYQSQCEITFKIRYPAGTYAYFISTQSFGQYRLEGNKSKFKKKAKLYSWLTLPLTDNDDRLRRDKVNFLEFEEWESKTRDYSQQKQEVPCGAKEFSFDFDMRIRLKSKNDEEFFKVDSSDIAKTMVKMELRKCEIVETK